jgi:hypothetical protein
MADKYLTISQLNSLFWDLTVQMLDLDINNPATQSAVRISWPIDGAPAWEITDNITFIKVLFDDDEYNRIRDVEYIDIVGDTNNVTQSTSYTKVLRIMWSFFGPDAEDRAQTIRDQLFYQDIHDVLAINDIYMITDVVEPIRAPELYETRWWERVDMFVRFNELITRNITVPVINEVNIYTTSGTTNPPPMIDSFIAEIPVNYSGIPIPATPVPGQPNTILNVNIDIIKP